MPPGATRPTDARAGLLGVNTSPSPGKDPRCNRELTAVGRGAPSRKLDDRAPVRLMTHVSVVRRWANRPMTHRTATRMIRNVATQSSNEEES